MQELIEWLREAAKTKVGGTAMINADDLLKTADMLESQAAEIVSLQETLDAVTRVASDAENLVISQRDELEKYKALCDQMGVAISKCRFDSLNMSIQDMVQAGSALTAWRTMK